MQGKKGWRGRQPWTNCDLHAMAKWQKRLARTPTLDKGGAQAVGEDANLGQRRGTTGLRGCQPLTKNIFPKSQSASLTAIKNIANVSGFN
jgi:hypothetical protein